MIAPCGPCGQAMPVDHDCPTLRALVQLAASTITPAPGLEAIRARTRETAPEAPGAATTQKGHRHA